MSKLRKFNKNENCGIRKTFIIVGICLAVSLLIAAISYAVYQKEYEILFINARIGEFKENDIELAMKVNGEQVAAPPSKDNFTVTVECDHADGEWDEEKWGAVITNISSNRVKCEVNFKTPEPTLSEVKAKSTRTSINLSYTAEGIETSTTCKYGLAENVYDKEEISVTNENCNITELEMDTTYYYQVCAINSGGKTCKEGNIKTKPEGLPVEIGDYISMTPTSTSYTPPSELTGCLNDSNCTQNTINPSELNLWRVISKNEDGTVDVVSEYVSSEKIYFGGKTGYMNFVGGLNEISRAYTNEKYVESTRHMGYSNQIETCAEVSATGCPTDSGYTIDNDLVYKATGTLIAKNLSGKISDYYLASRWFVPSGGMGGQWGRKMSEGSLNYVLLYFLPYDSNYTSAVSVRPILTLKSTNSFVDGDGKSAATAYTFSE